MLLNEISLRFHSYVPSTTTTSNSQLYTNLQNGKTKSDSRRESHTMADKAKAGAYGDNSVSYPTNLDARPDWSWPELKNCFPSHFIISHTDHSILIQTATIRLKTSLMHHAPSNPGVEHEPKQNDYRRKWDKEEYTARAKAQDAASAEYAQAASAAALAGKRPPPRPPRQGENVGPKPTKALEAREEDLGIERNLGKSMLVSAGGKGPGAGFYVS